MVRAALLRNPRAGNQEQSQQLVRWLCDAGWQIVLVSGELEEALANRPDVIVVAGGDGTVGEVAKRLAGTDVALAIVPTGTANNIARSVGVPTDSQRAASGLAHARAIDVDLGALSWNGGAASFIEGFGLGVFAQMMGERAGNDDKELPRAHELLAREIERFVPTDIELEIDGRDCSGRYLVAAVLNGSTVGPALALAPDARVDDGLFDVALAGEDEREAWIARLRGWRGTPEMPLPTLTIARARHVRLRADGAWSHADDQSRELRGEVKIDVMPGAVRFLVPRAA